MRTGLRNALVFSLLVAAAAVTWYWSRPAPERPGAGAESGAALGYYMLDGALAFTNAEGRTDFEIRFARLTELPDEDRVVLDDLAVAQTLEDSAWRISAERATGPADGTVFVLEDAVEVHLERARGDPYLIRMPRLELDRSSQIARGRGPIEVVTGASRLTAEVLEVDLNTRRLRLESVQGMRTSQITTAVAAAALSAAAAAQNDAPEGTQQVDTGRWLSLECEDECVIQGFQARSENWRLEAAEARAPTVEDVHDGQVRLTGVRFTLDDMSLAAPSAVFAFSNDAIVEAVLSGDGLQFESGGARFAARRIAFSFEDGELATAELSGGPARFENPEARDTATAETIVYDYRNRTVKMAGPFTFNREGRLQMRCLNLGASLRYDVDATRFTTGPCNIEGEGSAAPATPERDARGAAAPDSAAPAAPAPDGTP